MERARKELFKEPCAVWNCWKRWNKDIESFKCTRYCIFAENYMDAFANVKLEATGYPKIGTLRKSFNTRAFVWTRVRSSIIWVARVIEANAEFVVGKFPQRSNVIKTEQIQDPQPNFQWYQRAPWRPGQWPHWLDPLWIYCTNNFIQTDAKTSVVFAAFTTAQARRLMVYEELDTAGKP